MQKIFKPQKQKSTKIKYNVEIKTGVNRNSTTSTFLFVWFLDESWDHAVWYYSIEATTTIKKTKQKTNSC
jgi:hypothetical protein